MRLRLSVMMFLEYFIWGAWYVTIGTWLGQTLHFSGDQIGIIAGTTTIGAIVSPFLVGLMADEVFANQHLLAALHGVGGVLLWFAAGDDGWTGFWIPNPDEDPSVWRREETFLDRQSDPRSAAAGKSRGKIILKQQRARRAVDPKLHDD